MFNLWFFAAVGLALVDWLGTALCWKRMRWFTKGATLAALIAWFSAQGGWQNGLAWFGLGLVCGLIGDLVLQLPPRYFLGGLGAFLAGHIFYIRGFFSADSAFQPAIIIVGIIQIGLGIMTFMRWVQGLKNQNENASMRRPGIAYGVTITLMVVSAGLTLVNPAWPTSAAICCLVGAVLFMTSDALLAYRQFVRSFKYANLLVMVSYHLAQFLIITGALLSRA